MSLTNPIPSVNVPDVAVKQTVSEEQSNKKESPEEAPVAVDPYSNPQGAALKKKEVKKESVLDKLDKAPRYLSLIPKFLGDGKGGKIFQGWTVYLGENLLLGEKNVYKKAEDAIKQAMRVVMLAE